MAISSSGYTNGSRVLLRVILIGLLHFCMRAIPLCLCLGSGDGSLVKGSCIESERRALLAIKTDMYDPDEWLSSWRGSDCCGWRGVSCDNATGHVIKLNLRYPYDFDAQEKTGKLPGPSKINRSLLDLMHLKYLDLSMNNFSGTPIPTFICSLVYLKYLDLSNARFSGSIPLQLRNLSGLHFLDLHSDVYYVGEWTLYTNNLLWLSHMHSLQHLDLSGIDLSKAACWLQEINMHPFLLELNLSYTDLPSTFGSLSHINITSLKVLDLSHNDRTKIAVPHLLSNISSSLVYLNLESCSLPDRSLVAILDLCNLHHLDLSDNLITKEFFQKLGNFSQMKYLDLSKNHITGEIFQKLRNFSYLEHLDLSENQIAGEFFQKWGNISHLEYLDLSQNQVAGDVSQILANLGHLKYLYLSFNNIYGEIPEKLGNLSYLESLDMGFNKISGKIPKSIGDLHNLVELDLSANNNISGEIPESIEKLVHLQILDLSNNMISGEIPESIEKLVHLQILYLSDNMISGEIPDIFDKFYDLRDLSLSSNSITGKIPGSIGNQCKLYLLQIYDNNMRGDIVDIIESWSKCVENRLDDRSSPYGLTFLDLSYNNLSGIIPKSLGQLSALVFLDLTSNSFTGRLTEAHFANLMKLEYLHLRDNSFEVILSQDWIPPFNAIEIEMRSCQLGPRFPNWLQTQTHLNQLDLSNNSISDGFSNWLWDLKFINDLNVSHNSMKGRLPTSSRGQQYQYIDMSFNNFHGLLPNWDFSGLYSINLSNNSFEGPIPLSFAKATGLQFLSLSNNYINGSILPFICNLTNLVILDLSNNELFGRLPNCRHKSQLGIIGSQKDGMSGNSQSSVAGLIYLQSLHMRNNSLSGGIPLFLRYCKQLTVLDFSDNRFSGNLPIWIGESLTSLRVLSLRSNFFNGYLPKQLSYLTSLQVLDLACNDFSGALPQSFGNLSAMMTMEDMDKPFSKNSSIYYMENILMTTKGVEMEYTRVLSLVISIDLSCNNLSGMIPKELVNLRGLHFLNLSNNHFRGKIPRNIGALEQLESLDLSMNNLSGMIPSSISSIYSLSHLNLSHNNLSGKIPWGYQLQTFCDHSVYNGNPNLQGWPLPWCFNNASAGPFQPRSQEEEHGNKDEPENLWLYLSFALGFVVGLWGFIYAVMIKQKVRVAYFRFIDEAYDWIYVQLVVRCAKLKRIMLSNGQG